LLKKIMNSAHLTADINAPDKKTGTSYGSLQHFLQVNRAVRIGMLNNPLSGGNRNGLQKIRQAAAAAHPEVLQREVQTPTDVKETLADFARQEVNLLVVNGGDGTVQAALTAIFHKNFFETMPVLAVLRSAGTTSMIAGDILGAHRGRPRRNNTKTGAKGSDSGRNRTGLRNVFRSRRHIPGNALLS
jgi:ABC-type uncharacterized transport system substrate-binding protein